MGERGAALGLWVLVFWFVRRPIRLVVLFSVLVGLIGWFVTATDVRGDTHYVQTKRLALYDQPLGNKVMELQLNDSVVYLGAMSEEWKRVLRGEDTLFFQDFDLFEKPDYQTSKIRTSPFDCYDALLGYRAILQHPEGYFDTGDHIWKNGMKLIIIRYLRNSDEVVVADELDHDRETFPVSYVAIDWGRVLAEYPQLSPPQ